MKKIPKKKGYLQIDFAFAVFIFFYIVFVIYGLYSFAYASHNQEIEFMELSSLPRDICNYLISSPGYPLGWEAMSLNQAISVGLRGDSFLDNSLSSDKINIFGNSLNYNSISDKLGLDEIVYIRIDSVDNSINYLNFGFPSDTLKYSYSCYSSVNSDPVVIYVEVWR